MLILSRKAGEKVVIVHRGQAMVIEVNGCKSQHVKLAFDASDDWRFVRAEMAADILLDRLPADDKRATT